MQLVIKYGADYAGAKHDLVVAHYDDGATVPLDQFPGASLVSWHGDLAALDRVGPAPAVAGQMDARPYAAPTEIDLAAYAALRRYLTETGGVTVNGKKIATDRQSQALISGAVVRAQANPTASVAFKTATGFVTLTAAQVIALGNAVGDFVQACFQKEADLGADTRGLSVSKIDAAFASIPTAITAPATPAASS